MVDSGHIPSKVTFKQVFAKYRPPSNRVSQAIGITYISAPSFWDLFGNLVEFLAEADVGIFLLESLELETLKKKLGCVKV